MGVGGGDIMPDNGAPMGYKLTGNHTSYLPENNDYPSTGSGLVLPGTTYQRKPRQRGLGMPKKKLLEGMGYSQPNSVYQMLK